LIFVFESLYFSGIKESAALRVKHFFLQEKSISKDKQLDYEQLTNISVSLSLNE
jgi:hypothetical protein